MMATFPTMYRYGTLVQKPVVEVMDNVLAHDPTIRSTAEGGYVTTRARFTRLTRRWTIRYEWMGATNKGTLLTFEEARKAGAESFTWTNPIDSTAYTVRFMEPVRYTPHAGTNFLWWTVEFVLEQV
jgi:nitric oxide reductase large subunit